MIIQTPWKPLALIALVALSYWGLSSWRYAAGHADGKTEADRAWQAKWSQRDAGEAQAITDSVMLTLNIMNQAVEANRRERNQIALESQRAASDIKTAVAGDDCASRPVPAVAAQRLRQYADSIHSGASATDQH
ncbi:hypothetical protein [Edwardsiella anguillarum]|uniref:DUF2570 domain-containing protein n=1 Tax=Edwardsiella anguillarum TaxID=1821960 RepID=A0ABY8SK31_9GAMM|nr:hypothetical protein [Edwardsiella anguillarum]WHP85188.1 DUF2570 domain-containing protein [Edwardsiella anguillarum]WHP88971.1 DUF2570 domain-containing protein [Edwardsiella anguillarum]WHP92770.1 DUF2570 domain-containing protein [Edwardsiella anguillarum]WHP96575.1 DUF2570 domain-containing protein [Edwardsiella anguillarum]WHQ00446.1 DUF2570 domain-containing protein [Edwardsiella anguillarum]